MKGVLGYMIDHSIKAIHIDRWLTHHQRINSLTSTRMNWVFLSEGSFDCGYIIRTFKYSWATSQSQSNIIRIIAVSIYDIITNFWKVYITFKPCEYSVRTKSFSVWGKLMVDGVEIEHLLTVRLSTLIPESNIDILQVTIIYYLQKWSSIQMVWN